MSKPFMSTYLMIKKHKTTGLLYFCKTVTPDPLKYCGSGMYWKKHLKVHGREVDTVWYQLFHDEDDLLEFALFFSEFYDIVKAVDSGGKKLWANEVPENGLQGGQNKGMPSPLRGIPQPHVTAALTGKKRPAHSKLMKGVAKTESHRKNISKSLKEHTRTKEHGESISRAKRGKKLENKRIHKPVVCVYCGKEGKGPNMTRYHFNNCKGKT